LSESCPQSEDAPKFSLFSKLAALVPSVGTKELPKNIAKNECSEAFLRLSV
jgi:hypothetical protein